MRMRSNLLKISLIVLALGVAIFIIGSRQNWWGTSNDELDDTNGFGEDPEPNKDPGVTIVKTSTGTGTSTTAKKTTPKAVSKKLAYIVGKPKPAPEFNATNEAKTIATWLSDWTDLTGNDVKAFNKILIYRENELIAVHNAWLDKFPNGSVSGIKNTLRGQVLAEAVWNNRSDAVNKKAAVLKRLDELKIY